VRTLLDGLLAAHTHIRCAPGSPPQCQNSAVSCVWECRRHCRRHGPPDKAIARLLHSVGEWHRGDKPGDLYRKPYGRRPEYLVNLLDIRFQIKILRRRFVLSSWVPKPGDPQNKSLTMLLWASTSSPYNLHHRRHHLQELSPDFVVTEVLSAWLHQGQGRKTRQQPWQQRQRGKSVPHLFKYLRKWMTARG